MSSRLWLRVGLIALVAMEAVVGVWSLVFPRGFYDGFPLPGHPWVSPLPAYNEHLLRDFGGLNLGFALMFAVAAYTLNRTLIRTILCGYLVFAIPHLIFHLGHLEGFGTFDVVGQIVMLGLGVAVPVALLFPNPDVSRTREG